MKEAEAIQALYDTKKIYEGVLAINDPAFAPNAIAALEIAIRAVAKETPVKAQVISDIYEYDAICPACKNNIGVSPYCRWCGQRIDWEVSE